MGDLLKKMFTWAYEFLLFGKKNRAMFTIDYAWKKYSNVFILQKVPHRMTQCWKSHDYSYNFFFSRKRHKFSSKTEKKDSEKSVNSFKIKNRQVNVTSWHRSFLADEPTNETLIFYSFRIVKNILHSYHSGSSSSSEITQRSIWNFCWHWGSQHNQA